MKFKKLVFNLTTWVIISGIIFAFTSTSAFAKYYRYGYDLYRISYKVVDTGGFDWYVDKAADSWEYTIGTNFSKISNSSNKVRIVSDNYTWLGLYSPQISNGKVLAFRIDINWDRISRSYGWQGILSVITHEFGHALFLGDYEVGEGWGNKSIMSHERDRTKIYTPQTHDINEVHSYMNR